MNFYASPDYLSVVSETYFKNRRVALEDVRVGSNFLRLLVVDNSRVITALPFLDYHEPLRDLPDCSSCLVHPYAEVVAQGVVAKSEWDQEKYKNFVPAPFVDWSLFPTIEAYRTYVRQNGGSIIREQERRRRRLVESVGELDFTFDDASLDTLELARAWKSRQLRDTGHFDYFIDSRNVAFFDNLRDKGLLVASTLRARGRLLAVWLGFVYEGTWSGWIFTHDPDPATKKYSTGHQLLHCMLEESHRRGHKEFDFSIGGEPYKWLYSTHARLLAPAGKAPLRKRIFTQTDKNIRRALSQYPAVYSRARSATHILKRTAFNALYILPIA